MKGFAASERDMVFCRRVCRLTVWLQTVLTLLLTIKTLVMPVYAVLALWLVMELVLARLGRKHRAARVIARVLSALTWVLAALFLLYLALSLVTGWAAASAAFLRDMSALCLPVLGAMMPGLTAMALGRGKYDRTVACFGQTWLLLTAVLGRFTAARTQIPWLWDNAAVLSVWLGLVVLATVMVWACALLRVKPDQDEAPPPIV